VGGFASRRTQRFIFIVIPAKAGIHFDKLPLFLLWIPASAGMTCYISLRLSAFARDIYE
jgi:hypothetical protein